MSFWAVLPVPAVTRMVILRMSSWVSIIIFGAEDVNVSVRGQLRCCKYVFLLKSDSLNDRAREYILKSYHTPMQGYIITSTPRGRSPRFIVIHVGAAHII